MSNKIQADIDGGITGTKGIEISIIIMIMIVVVSFLLLPNIMTGMMIMIITIEMYDSQRAATLAALCFFLTTSLPLASYLSFLISYV